MAAIFLRHHALGGKLECWGNVMLLCSKFRIKVGNVTNGYQFTTCQLIRATGKMMLGENLDRIWVVFQSKIRFNYQICCLTLKNGPMSLDSHRVVHVILVADGSGSGEMLRTCCT